MELIYAIAEYFKVPNEWITITQASDNLAWFRLNGVLYSCKTVRKGKYLKKNSIRLAR
jgi:hypothetical protein